MKKDWNQYIDQCHSAGVSLKTEVEGGNGKSRRGSCLLLHYV